MYIGQMSSQACLCSWGSWHSGSWLLKSQTGRITAWGAGVWGRPNFDINEIVVLEGPGQPARESGPPGPHHEMDQPRGSSCRGPAALCGSENQRPSAPNSLRFSAFQAQGMKLKRKM